MGKRKILIVDDDKSVLKLIEFRLKQNNYDTVVALDGEQALKKAYEEKPTVKTV